MMAVVLTSATFIIQETGFGVVQTNLPTSRDTYYFCNKSFPIFRFVYGNIFLLVETWIPSVGKTVVLPMMETDIPKNESICFCM